MLGWIMGLIAAAPVVVNDGQFDKNLSDLAAAAADSASTIGEQAGARDELAHQMALGLGRLDAALESAEKAALTPAERAPHHVLRRLVASLRSAGRSARMHFSSALYDADLVGADVDPLERFAFLADCVDQGLDSIALYACVSDWDRFEPAAAKARAEELAQDPAARRLVAERFDARVVEIQKAFSDLERVAREDGVAAALIRARAAFAAWDGAVVQPLGAAWEMAADVEAKLALQLPAERFAGCEAAFAPARADLAREVGAERERATSALAQNPAWGILVDAEAICAYADHRFHVAAGLSRFGSRALAVDRRSIVRGPRAMAVRAAMEAPSALGYEDFVLPERDPVDAAMYAFRGNTPRSYTYEGVIAGLRQQGASVRIDWKREKIPDTTYSCSGSNRITGAYVAGGQLGLTRDVSCGYYVTGMVDVTNAPVIIPAAAAEHLAVGQLVTLELPYRDGEVYDSDARYALQIDGHTIVAKKVPETFPDAFIVDATDKAGRNLAVLLGTPVASPR